MTCNRCEDKGAVRLHYHSGEPFDVAVCWCRAGVAWRQMEAKRSGVLADYFKQADRVVWLEDVASDEDFTRWGCERPSDAPDVVGVDLLRGAGRMQKAGLGGQKVAP